MIGAGQVQQDTATTVILNSANGVQRFGVNGPVPEGQADVEVVLEEDGMEDGEKGKN